MRRENEGWVYLLLRVYGYWDFPKGVVEPGEDAYHGALRELREETGIQKATSRWGCDYYETPRYSGHKIARYYLAEVPDSAIHLTEHHEYRWVRYRDAEELLGPRVRSVLNWGKEQVEDPPG